MKQKIKPQAKKYPHKYGLEEETRTPLDVFGYALESKLADAIYQRSPIEDRMVKDLRRYKGLYDEKTETGLKEKGRSRAFNNITRTKAEAAEAQMIDLLFPNSGKNWGINPTPVPELMDKADSQKPYQIGEQRFLYEDTGEEVTEGDVVAQQMDEARKRCDSMAKEIDDQLTECDYDKKARKAIHDGVVFGTGILKAPVVTGKVSPVYKSVAGQSGFQLLQVQKFVPAVEAVRPWDFFPDMAAEELEQCEYIFERSYLSRKQVAKLALRRGIQKAKLREVLKMEGHQTQHRTAQVDAIRQLSGMHEQITDDRYELWEYHGALDKDALLELGIIDDEQYEDPLVEIYGKVLLIGGIVIQVEPELLPAIDAGIYNVWNWEVDDTCLFGYGVPHRVESSQDVCNATWRMALDHAASTTGGQVAINKTKVQPADGDYEVQPFKVWELKAGVTDIKQAISTFEFQSHIPELIQLYQIARQFMDEESGVPMIQQGEQGQNMQTLGEASMRMNAANTVRRRQVKAWDDEITTKIITGFYHFNMEFSANDEIKGDYQVDAMGSSALLVREIQAQAILNFISITANNPIFQPMLQMKAREILAEWVKTQQLPDHLLPTEEEIATWEKNLQDSQSNGEGGTSPEEVRLETVRIQQQIEQAKIEAVQRNLAYETEAAARLKRQDDQIEMAKLQIKVQEGERQERLAIFKLRQEDKINGDKLQAMLQRHQTDQQIDLHKFNAEIALKENYYPEANYGLDS